MVLVPGEDIGIESSKGLPTLSKGNNHFAISGEPKQACKLKRELPILHICQIRQLVHASHPM